MTHAGFEDFLTPHEAAVLATELGQPVSAAGARYWADSGRVPVTRTASGQRLFRRSDVIHFLADRAAKAAARAARKDVARG